jgi:hypothetical protein
MGEHTNSDSFAVDWTMITEKDKDGNDKFLTTPDNETAPKHASVAFFVKTATYSPTSAQPVGFPSKLHIVQMSACWWLGSAFTSAPPFFPCSWIFVARLTEEFAGFNILSLS